MNSAHTVYTPAVTVPVVTPIDALTARVSAEATRRGQPVIPVVARAAARHEWMRHCAIAVGRAAVLQMQGPQV